MAIKTETRFPGDNVTQHADALPPMIDLPPGVITHMSQLSGVGLRPSIFGACSDSALVKAKVLRREELDDEQWIKRRLRHGIELHKCARKKQDVKKRTLGTNQTFTVLNILGGRTKKVHTSDITAVHKGKASDELGRTSTAVHPNMCLVLETRKRTYSFILPSDAERDRIVRGLEKLLNKKSSDSSLPPITEATTDHDSRSSVVISDVEPTPADEVAIVVLPETVPCALQDRSFFTPGYGHTTPVNEDTINSV